MEYFFTFFGYEHGFWENIIFGVDFWKIFWCILSAWGVFWQMATRILRIKRIFADDNMVKDERWKVKGEGLDLYSAYI